MAKHSKEYYFEQIRQNLNNDKRFADKLEWIKKMVKNYSEKLGFSEADIIEKFEEKRTYWSANYYQPCTQPELDDKVVIFDTLEDFKKAFPSGKFRCGICNGITTDPNKCNSGVKLKSGIICDWKTYGLFPSPNVFRFTIKKDFLERPYIYSIFQPIELEQKSIAEILTEIKECENV